MTLRQFCRELTIFLILWGGVIAAWGIADLIGR